MWVSNLIDLSEQFKRARIASRLTQREAAAAAGVSPLLVSHFERGALNELGSVKLLSLLRKLRAEGRVIDAMGAPVKGSTLMNYCGIGPDLIRCAVEVNEFKIGRLTPGTHIPIVDEREERTTPDYYLVLAWNFLDFFREKYEGYLKKGGQFIVPHPEVHCIGIQ